MTLYSIFSKKQYFHCGNEEIDKHFSKLKQINLIFDSK